MASDAKKGRGGFRTWFILTELVVLVMVILVPFGVINLVNDLNNPPAEQLFTISPKTDPDAGTTTYNRVHIDVAAIDEIGEQVTLRVSGTHFCAQNCAEKDKIVLYSINPFERDEEGLPASDSITLPTTPTQFAATIKLPIANALFRYPFDESSVTLGLSLERIGADNEAVEVPDDQARGELFVTVRDKVSQLKMYDPKPINPEDVRPLKVDNFDYVAVSELTFHRSDYLKALVVGVLLLVTLVFSYAVFLRTFDQVITNAGPVIFGIFGVRTLILGGFPANVTAVDLVLTGLVVFLLLVTVVRGLGFLFERSDWRKKNEPGE